MRQIALLIGGFTLTLTVLFGAFFGYRALAGNTIEPGASATPAAIAAVTPAPTVKPVASRAPAATPKATSAPTATPTSAPTPTPAPVATPKATPSPVVKPGDKIVITVAGKDYANADVSDGGSVTLLPRGAVRIETGGNVVTEVELTYEIPAGSLPAGATIINIDTAVCATGRGQFWETYGPEGSSPEEYEVVAPSSDGCFHFAGANGPDSRTLAIVEKTSSMDVLKVVYTVTLAK